VVGFAVGTGFSLVTNLSSARRTREQHLTFPKDALLNAGTLHAAKEKGRPSLGRTQFE